MNRKIGLFIFVLLFCAFIFSVGCEEELKYSIDIKDNRIVIVEDVPSGKKGDVGYDISVSSTYQVEIMDIFKPNYGILSWFPVKDFDFDINYSTYGQYAAFGSVVNGMDVVDIVATVSTDSADKPFVDQSLNSIRFVKEYEVSE